MSDLSQIVRKDSEQIRADGSGGLSAIKWGETPMREWRTGSATLQSCNWAGFGLVRSWE